MRAHPRATFFHLSDWRGFVERTYGHEPADLVALRGDEVAGVLPLMVCPGLVSGLRLISMPYAVYGGPLGADADVERALVAQAMRMADERRVKYLELRCFEEPALDLPANDLYATFLRDLPDDPAGVLAAMPKKARAEARKARERHGLELSEGPWYVDDLARLFLLNKQTLGSPALPPRHFRGLLELGDAVHVHLVRQGSDPVAAVLSFGFRETLIAYYAGTVPGADRTVSASNFMYAALQEWAVEKGYRVFDFCRSRRDSGAFRFKQHQGFEETALRYRYHLVRSRAIPSFTPSNPRTALLRKAWSKLPLWVARRLSASLARHLC